MNLEAIDRRALHLQINSIERSTVKNYATGARNYISFCVSHSLPLDPTPQTLSRYIAYTSQFISSGPKYLTGARHFLKDIYPAFDANRSHALVQSTVRGSHKVRGDPIHRKLPLRTTHLQKFSEIADKTQSYDDFLFITILACAFYGCHRIGELVINNDHNLFDWRKIIKRSSIIFSTTRVQYRLPYHKADPLYHGTDVLLIQQKTVNPVTFLRLYISKRDRIHGCRAALWLKENGSHPNRSWFNHKFFSILNHDYGGHSARAGGATFFASLGVSENVIQALGRWSSSAWKIYIRDNPSIRAEQEIASLHSRLH